MDDAKLDCENAAIVEFSHGHSFFFLRNLKRGQTIIFLSNPCRYNSEWAKHLGKAQNHMPWDINPDKATAL